MSENEEAFMRLAIEEAKKGKNTAPPNPIVGAVIVEEGEVVASGYHVRPGESHAEVIALRNLNRLPQKGATMYVTLEPCSTTGRTGKCTDIIIQSGLAKIVLGAIDPNPAHQGKGVEILEAAGIEVKTGVLQEECANLNQEFNERMKEVEG